MQRGFILLIIMVFSSGCSTIIHGSKQDVNITTNPPNLSARINTKECRTPCTLTEVSRKSEMITIDGKDFRLEKSFNGWSTILGNFWNYIIIGVIVDSSSGASYSIEDVDLFIEPKSEASLDLSH